MRIGFCEGGYYCSVHAWTNPRYRPGDSRTVSFSVWYPYKGNTDSETIINWPTMNLKTLPEFKEVQAGLAKFIELLENPPVYDKKPPHVELKWLVKYPGQSPEVERFSLPEDRLVDEQLELAQSLVGGYVEAVPIGPGVSILCNEDGIYLNLPTNCGFVGTIVVVGHSDEDWVALTDEQIRKAKAWLQNRIDHKGSGPFEISTVNDIDEKLSEARKAIVTEWESL